MAQILLVTNDLIFSTKITGTARQLGRTIAETSTLAKAQKLLSAETRIVLVDLSTLPVSADSDLAELKQAAGGASVVAYGSHVDVDRLQMAKDAGCDEVLARSEFTRRLPELCQV